MAAATRSWAGPRGVAVARAACVTRPSASAPRSTSSSVVTTRSAPAIRRSPASPARAIPIARMAPALAACTPTGASSTTRQLDGATASCSAARRKRSGYGFPRTRSVPDTFAANASSSVPFGPTPSNGILAINAVAFREDDAAANRNPRARSAVTSRSASGNAVKSPASISSSSRRCLRRAYSIDRACVRDPEPVEHGARAGEPRPPRDALLNTTVVKGAATSGPSSSASVSRHARSCGDATKTPSTSNTAAVSGPRPTAPFGMASATAVHHCAPARQDKPHLPVVRAASGGGGGGGWIDDDRDAPAFAGPTLNSLSVGRLRRARPRLTPPIVSTADRGPGCGRSARGSLDKGTPRVETR